MIYIAQYQPYGWFRFYEIPEKECIDAYLKGVSAYKDAVQMHNYGIFNIYMYLLHCPHTIIGINDNGQIVRYWNNQAWVVVEASDETQALHKAIDILVCHRTYVDQESLIIARATNLAYARKLRSLN